MGVSPDLLGGVSPPLLQREKHLSNRKTAKPSNTMGQKQDRGTQMPRREEDWGMPHPLPPTTAPQTYCIKLYMF